MTLHSSAGVIIPLPTYLHNENSYLIISRDQSTRNFNYSPFDFFLCSTKVTSFLLPLMNVLPCKNKNCSTLPLCNVESFWECKCNVIILISSVFFSHFIFWLKCDEDLRHREYHVARTAWVRGRMWLGRGCAWRGVGRVGAWLRPPQDGWQAGGTHPAGMPTCLQ